ncbi:cytochrome P450 4c3-like isoform X2 [Cotesia glomerata]|uniref:cytochrome P450 4c3-like isoform X2 n=1 Tax=Cotesia glomerata TaxID=32391 RepID=UPI001D03432D|nr:cytochrome P450 4c3-like isoform X2 [Cotesia glomerata]
MIIALSYIVTSILLSGVLLLIIAHFYYHNRNQGRLCNLIPGPKFYPIIGNALDVTIHPEDTWNFLRRTSINFYPVWKVWFGFSPVVNIRHPDDIEILLCSSKHIEKSMFYDLLHPWLHDGLLTSTGEKWRSRRKVLTPAFHLHNLKEYMDCFTNHTNRLIKNLKLESGSDGVIKELLPLVTTFTLHTIVESTMGVVIEENDMNQYKNSLYEFGEILVYRSFRPWLQNDFIFGFTSRGREYDRLLKKLHNFTKKNRVRAEVEEVLIENNGEANFNDLQRLTYLECCIKESLRLYPTVPTISRKTQEDLVLKHCIVPKETILNVQIFDTHRDANFRPRPNVFDPDRFLPENSVTRHPFSFIPFSAGSRNCIGQKFAMLELKTFMAGLLYNFYLEPQETTADLRLIPDLVIRPAHPVYVKFVPINR